MPIYQYKCDFCGNEFELFKKLNGTDIVLCPICGEEATRIFSSVGIIFKGPGFYTTDSRKFDDKPKDFKYPKKSSKKNDNEN